MLPSLAFGFCRECQAMPGANALLSSKRPVAAPNRNTPYTCLCICVFAVVKGRHYVCTRVTSETSKA
jgi:hypothetical protein